MPNFQLTVHANKILPYLWLALISTRASAQDNTGNYNIRLARVISVGARLLNSEDTTLYKATILIGKAHQHGYWIPEYGMVKKQDTVVLLTGRNKVDVYQADKKKLLVSLELKDPIYLQGSISYEMPRENDFPGFGRSGKLRARPGVEEKIREVLDCYSKQGYIRNESSGTVTIITPYIGLPLAPISPRLGFISFYLKYNARLLGYEVKTSMLESMKLDTEKRTVSSAEVKNAAQEMLQKFINDLSK